MFTLASKAELPLLSAPHLELNSPLKVKGKKYEPQKGEKKNHISSILNILNVLWRFLFSLLPYEELIQPNSRAEDLLNSKESVNFNTHNFSSCRYLSCGTLLLTNYLNRTGDFERRY